LIPPTEGPNQQCEADHDQNQGPGSADVGDDVQVRQEKHQTDSGHDYSPDQFAAIVLWILAVWIAHCRYPLFTSKPSLLFLASTAMSVGRNILKRKTDGKDSENIGTGGSSMVARVEPARIVAVSIV
jgi:hypothetical protein